MFRKFLFRLSKWSISCNTIGFWRTPLKPEGGRTIEYLSPGRGISLLDTKKTFVCSLTLLEASHSRKLVIKRDTERKGTSSSINTKSQFLFRKWHSKSATLSEKTNCHPSAFMLSKHWLLSPLNTREKRVVSRVSRSLLVSFLTFLTDEMFADNRGNALLSMLQDEASSCGGQQDELTSIQKNPPSPYKLACMPPR